MNTQHAGIFGFTEPNLNWSDPGVKDTIGKVSRTVLKRYRMQTSESVEPGMERYKPGGTLTVAVQPWCGRIADRGDDTTGLGRWSWIKLRGTQNKFVFVITAYRPVAGGNEEFELIFNDLSQEMRCTTIQSELSNTAYYDEVTTIRTPATNVLPTSSIRLIYGSLRTVT
jgi:hypothetical protein